MHPKLGMISYVQNSYKINKLANIRINTTSAQIQQIDHGQQIKTNHWFGDKGRNKELFFRGDFLGCSTGTP